MIPTLPTLGKLGRREGPITLLYISGRARPMFNLTQ